MIMQVEESTDAVSSMKSGKDSPDFPKMWKVVIFNDDITPMSFVVDVLVQIFKLGKTLAYDKMMESNDTGNAVVGVYPKGIAEMKKIESDRKSRAMGFPLRVETERCE